MFVVREDNLEGEQTRSLLTMHLAELHANSPPGAVFALDLSGLQVPEVTVWSAWCGDSIASIGALKTLDDDTGEVKSMRTHPAFLRMGAAVVILGIETSCDETAAALVTADGEIRASVVASQADLHARYGGVV